MSSTNAVSSAEMRSGSGVSRAFAMIALNASGWEPSLACSGYLTPLQMPATTPRPRNAAWHGRFRAAARRDVRWRVSALAFADRSAGAPLRSVIPAGVSGQGRKRPVEKGAFGYASAGIWLGQRLSRSISQRPAGPGGAEVG